MYVLKVEIPRQSNMPVMLPLRIQTGMAHFSIMGQGIPDIAAQMGLKQQPSIHVSRNWPKFIDISWLPLDDFF